MSMIQATKELLDIIEKQKIKDTVWITFSKNEEEHVSITIFNKEKKDNSSIYLFNFNLKDKMEKVKFILKNINFFQNKLEIIDNIYSYSLKDLEKMVNKGGDNVDYSK